MKFTGIKFTFLIVLTSPIIAVVVWLCCQMDAGPGKIRNVLLISIDTCRSDYLSCYDYPLETTPNIDAIANEGILFENQVSFTA